MCSWLRLQFYLPAGKSSGCIFSAPFPGSHSKTCKARSPSWPSPEHRRRESRATKKPMLSVFLGHVKHLEAVLIDTLELCMERSGAVLGCALLSSCHPPFSVLVPYLLPNQSFLWKSWSPWFFVCLARLWAHLWEIQQGQRIPQTAVGQHVRTGLVYRNTTLQDISNTSPAGEDLGRTKIP